MSKPKKVLAAKIANVTTATPVEVEVSPEQLSELIKAEQADDANADTVKLLVVGPDRTGGIPKVKKVKIDIEVEPIPAKVLEALKGHNLNIVNSIKTLFASGYTKPQIIAAGYNTSTVYRQVGEYIKSLEELATEKEVVVEKSAEIMEEVASETEEIND